MIDKKGINRMKQLLNQTVGNRQCYALAAEYAGVMIGPDLGAGTKYEIKVRNGNVFSAADIGTAYNWNLYLWEVIENPLYDQLKVGAIINWRRGAKVSEFLRAHKNFGHTGVISGLENGKIQTYEQNGESGEIVSQYEREFYGSEHIASICIPPDFEKDVML